MTGAEKADAHSKQSLRLWLRLLRCSTAIEKRMRAMLVQRFDTTLPRFDVMAMLDRAPDGLTMSELSDRLLVSNGNVTPIVSRLVGDGLITRTQDRNDRRVLRTKLTAKGRRDFRAMAGEHEKWIERLLGDLGDDEMQHLIAGLDRVRTSVERNGA